MSQQALMASIELNRVEQDRPHTTAPGIRVRVYGCGCQLNTRDDAITGSWLCQYHEGYQDGWEAAVTEGEKP